MNKAKQRKYMKEYYARHRERILAERKEKYQEDEDYRERMIKNASQWYDDNREQANNTKNKYNKRKYVKQRVNEYNASYYSKNKDIISEKRKAKRNEVKIIENEGGVENEI